MVVAIIVAIGVFFYVTPIFAEELTGTEIENYVQRVTYDYTGYYIGELTAYPDPLGTSKGVGVEMDGNFYEVSEDFVWNNAVSVWVDNKDKNVICEFQKGKIICIDALRDVIQPVFISSTSTEDIIYQNGKIANNSITLQVKVGTKLNINKSYDIEKLKNAQGKRARVYKLRLAIQSEKLSFADNKTNQLEQDVSIDVGDTEVKSYKIKIDKNYIPDKINTNIEIIGKMVMGTNVDIDCESIYLKAGNIDMQTKNVNIAKKNTTVGKKVNAATTDLNNSTAVALDETLAYYFSNEQQKEIKNELTVWIAEIIQAQTFKTEDMTEKMQQTVTQKILKKLGVELKSTSIFQSMTATTKIKGKSLDGTTITVSFTFDCSNYRMNEDASPYAGFGNIKYTILNNKTDYPSNGTGVVTFASIENFANQVKGIVEGEIYSAYSIWGNDANKIANAYVETPFGKLLAGNFSGKVYSLITEPTESYVKKISVKCPVDVYIYDTDGKLCGAIVNNVIDRVCQVKCVSSFLHLFPQLSAV